jgi:uncharacterized Tic20 family protein
MYEVEINNPLQDERIMAGLAHVSAILPMMGVIAPIVIWATQKDKSKYVAFQALQAVAYQLAMILAYFICMAFYALSMFGSFFLSIPVANESGAPVFMFLPFCVFGLIFLGGGIVILYALYGAYRTFQGYPFRYRIIADQVDKFMKSNNNGK